MPSFLSCRDDPGTLRVRMPLNARRGSGLAARHVHPGYPWHQAWAPPSRMTRDRLSPRTAARRARRAAAARTGTPLTYGAASLASYRRGLACIAHCAALPLSSLPLLQRLSRLPEIAFTFCNPRRPGVCVQRCPERGPRESADPVAVAALLPRSLFPVPFCGEGVRFSADGVASTGSHVCTCLHGRRGIQAVPQARCCAALAATMPDGLRHRFEDGRKLIAAVMVGAGSRRAKSPPRA